MSDYYNFLARLKILDAKQLYEVFHDLEDLEQVQRIEYVAREFLDKEAWKDCEL